MSYDPSGATVDAGAVWETDYATGARRCFVWSGAPPSPVAPAAGGDIDGVSGPIVVRLIDEVPTNFVPYGWLAQPGFPVKVEASAAFSAGASLETGSDGRVKAVVSGKAVLRALQASAGAGSVVWAVFTSGR